MTIRTSVHDHLFRGAMSDVRVAKEFFSRHLPENIRKAINLEILILCPQNYIDSELKGSQSDIVYQTEIANSQGYIMLACEHQSTPDPLMAFRLLKYNVGIWQNHLKQTGLKTLPLIVNLVFFNGRTPYGYSTDFRDLFAAPRMLVDDIWGKPFKLINVQESDDEELIQQQWSGILEFFMKNIIKRDFLPYLKKALRQLQWLEQQENSTELLLNLLNYALIAGKTPNVPNFVNTVKNGLSAPIGEKIVSIAEQLVEQGTRQGEHRVFLRQLTRKFSVIPEEYASKIEAADEDTLLEWAEHILDAKTFEDIFNT